LKRILYWIYCAHKKIIKIMPFFQPLEWYYSLTLSMRIAFHAGALSVLINELSVYQCYQWVISLENNINWNLMLSINCISCRRFSCSN